MPSINPVGPDFGFSFLIIFFGRGEATRAGGGLVGIGGGGVTSSAIGGVASGWAAGGGLCTELDGSRDARELFGNNKTGVLDPDWAGLVAEVCVRTPIRGL